MYCTLQQIIRVHAVKRKPLMLSLLPHSAPHLYLSFSKSPRPAVIFQGHIIQRPLQPLLYHLASDSPTHSAIQGLALSILFFRSFFLTHATSQMGSIL